MEEELRQKMKRGQWVRRMSREDFRRMKPGEVCGVLIGGYLESEALRVTATKMGRICGCKFSVNHTAGSGHAYVTRQKETTERER